MLSSAFSFFYLPPLSAALYKIKCFPYLNEKLQILAQYRWGTAIGKQVKRLNLMFNQ